MTSILMDLAISEHQQRWQERCLSPGLLHWGHLRIAPTPDQKTQIPSPWSEVNVSVWPVLVLPTGREGGCEDDQGV